jgi:amidase
MASKKRWQDIARERKLKQEDSIPQEWRIELPLTEVQNVMDIPRTCGRLNDHELAITEERDVDVILKHISSREWTSLDVMTAFLKRAIIAHQLVSAP